MEKSSIIPDLACQLPTAVWRQWTSDYILGPVGDLACQVQSKLQETTAVAVVASPRSTADHSASRSFSRAHSFWDHSFSRLGRQLVFEKAEIIVEKATCDLPSY